MQEECSSSGQAQSSCPEDLSGRSTSPRGGGLSISGTACPVTAGASRHLRDRSGTVGVLGRSGRSCVCFPPRHTATGGRAVIGMTRSNGSPRGRARCTDEGTGTVRGLSQAQTGRPVWRRPSRPLPRQRWSGVRTVPLPPQVGSMGSAGPAAPAPGLTAPAPAQCRGRPVSPCGSEARTPGSAVREIV